MHTCFYSRLKRSLLCPLLMIVSTTAIAKETETFGDIANNLLFGVGVVTDFLHAICLFMGIGFVIYSIVAYRNHRLNPKMVPLDRPILYLLLGLAFASVPFLGTIVGRTTVAEKRHHNSIYHSHHDIDAADDDDDDIDTPLHH